MADAQQGLKYWRAKPESQQLNCSVADRRADVRVVKKRRLLQENMAGDGPA